MGHADATTNRSNSLECECVHTCTQTRLLLLCLFYFRVLTALRSNPRYVLYIQHSSSSSRACVSSSFTSGSESIIDRVHVHPGCQIHRGGVGVYNILCTRAYVLLAAVELGCIKKKHALMCCWLLLTLLSLRTDILGERPLAGLPTSPGSVQLIL